MQWSSGTFTENTVAISLFCISDSIAMSTLDVYRNQMISYEVLFEAFDLKWSLISLSFLWRRILVCAGTVAVRAAKEVSENGIQGIAEEVCTKRISVSQKREAEAPAARTKQSFQGLTAYLAVYTYAVKENHSRELSCFRFAKESLLSLCLTMRGSCSQTLTIDRKNRRYRLKWSHRLLKRHIFFLMQWLRSVETHERKFWTSAELWCVSR